MQMEKNINKNAIYNLLKSCCQIVFPLITFPYISRVLLTENVGRINYSNSIVSYINLIAALGINTYAVRECARVRDEKKELDKTASELYSINIITTVVAYMVLAIVLIVVNKLADYRYLIGLLSASVLFTTLGADWINTAMEDFKYITVRTFAFQLFALIGMFLFVHKPDDYYKYALITVLSSSGGNIVNMFYRKRYCKTRFTFETNWRKHMKPILLLFAMLLSQTIFVNSDTTILGYIRGDHEVGLYSTSVKIYNLVNTMVASVAMVVMPQMSNAYVQRNYKEMNRLFNYAAQFIVVLGLPCVVGINMICPELIRVIAGEKYLGATTSLHILSVALAFSLIGGLIGNVFLLPCMKEDVSLRSCIYAAIINIVLNIILIPKYGLNAAALTTAVSQFVAMIYSLRYIDRHIKIDNWKDLLLGPIWGSILIICVCVLVSFLFDNWFVRFGVAVALSVIIYIMSLIMVKNTFAVSMMQSIYNKVKRK